jgi:hypothetical protein
MLPTAASSVLSLKERYIVKIQRRLSALLAFALISMAALSTVSGDTLEIRDGVAICRLTGSSTEWKLGEVKNGHVKLYLRFGGRTVSLDEVRKTIEEVDRNGVDNAKSGRRNLMKAFFKQMLPGIWKVESGSVNGKPQTIQATDPMYLVLRDDGSSAHQKMDQGQGNMVAGSRRKDGI